METSLPAASEEELLLLWTENQRFLASRSRDPSLAFEADPQEPDGFDMDYSAPTLTRRASPPEPISMSHPAGRFPLINYLIFYFSLLCIISAHPNVGLIVTVSPSPSVEESPAPPEATPPRYSDWVSAKC